MHAVTDVDTPLAQIGGAIAEVAKPVSAATCGGDFNAFLSAMAREAAAAGVSRSVVDSAFAGLTPDGAVLAFDRLQRGTFRKSFEEYASTRVAHSTTHRK